VEDLLIREGLTSFRFRIVRQGTEESWLRSRMQKADFTGALRGEALASAHANMNLKEFIARIQSPRDAPRTT
jgi:hypothetical protein